MFFCLQLQISLLPLQHLNEKQLAIWQGELVR